MFRIGEFSKLTRVSVRMLRYYDETGLLPPAEIDPATGYRLYGADQIPVLGRIVFLRDLGFPVAEMAETLEHWDQVAHRLEDRRRSIEATIAEEREKLDRIDMAIRDIARDDMEHLSGVTIKEVPGQLVLSLRRVIPDYYAEGALWKEMARFAQQSRVGISSDTFSIYHDTDYRETEVDVEVCAPAAAAGESRDGLVFRHTETVPHMACTMVYGPFENIAGAYRAFAGWLQEHTGYRMTGQSRQIVHRGPWNEPDPRRYVTEIQIPLEKQPPVDFALDSHTV